MIYRIVKKNFLIGYTIHKPNIFKRIFDYFKGIKYIEEERRGQEYLFLLD